MPSNSTPLLTAGSPTRRRWHTLTTAAVPMQRLLCCGQTSLLKADQGISTPIQISLVN
jgi:hypothetical protein